MSLTEVASLQKATLRTHPAPVTSAQFHPTDSWLASGDEAGWCFWWSITQRRPIAIWKPHEKSIIGIKWLQDWEVGRCRILLTHGRDNKIKIFRLNVDDPASEGYNNSIPISLQADGSSWKSPWLVHSQDVNAMNFCSVSVSGTTIAVPSTLDSEKIDIYDLRPEFSRPFSAIQGKPDKSMMNSNSNTNSFPSNPNDFSAFDLDSPDKRSVSGTGIIMALILTKTKLIAGYESGHIIVFDISEKGSPKQIYSDKSHQHTILSLALNHSGDSFLSSSTDSLLVKHSLTSSTPLQVINIKHVGLTSLDIRSDGKIFATAGWDGMVRVYSYKTMKQLAAFKGSEGRITEKAGITSVVFSPISSSVNDDSDKSSQAIVKQSALEIARQKRALQTHWIAVASKDGRIRLSDIY